MRKVLVGQFGSLSAICMEKSSIRMVFFAMKLVGGFIDSYVPP